MKKSRLFLLVLSLLIGIIVTVATSRVNTTHDLILGQNCGSSFNSQTDLHTALKPCTLLTYGWPVTYITSGVAVNLLDYHTVYPNNPANITNAIGYTSISRTRFLADWLIWSVAAGIVVTGINMTICNNSKNKSKK
ncbi:MAG TPA: hypothetical protein VMR76_01440 [Candidatus Saccharimonadia bacterium]|nr:hypothetical protein [Candidatus Saccharimonadia bacterium]